MGIGNDDMEKSGLGIGHDIEEASEKRGGCNIPHKCKWNIGAALKEEAGQLVGFSGIIKLIGKVASGEGTSVQLVRVPAEEDESAGGGIVAAGFYVGNIVDECDDLVRIFSGTRAKSSPMFAIAIDHGVFRYIGQPDLVKSGARCIAVPNIDAGVAEDVYVGLTAEKEHEFFENVAKGDGSVCGKWKLVVAEAE